MAVKRASNAGMTHAAHRPYVAYVEGKDGGIAFGCYYKRMDVARRDAIRFNGRLHDLRTATIYKWKAKVGWVEADATA